MQTDLEARPSEPAIPSSHAGPDGGPSFAFLGGGILAVVALVFGLLFVMVVAAKGSGDGHTAAKASPLAAATPAATSFDVELGDLYVKPKAITVPAGKVVTLKVTNKGAIQHDLVGENGKGTKLIDPGGTETVTFGPYSAASVLFCNVPGHRAAGMELQVAVAGGAATSAGTASAATPANADATIDFNATPATDWKPFDPTLKPADGATVHDVTFHATETVLEVAPGVKQQMWTFNGHVPGPILRGHVGDVFNVTLVNDGTMGHSIDFHASHAAWNDKMRTIKPGESLVYQFKATNAGIFMYHCGTAPALHHIGNGMYGAVIVDPPSLAPVDREFVLLQSELYTGPASQPGDLTKMQKANFDAVMFNGYVNQYKYSPIRVEPNQKVRVWVLDAGPNENSSFHIVGTIFDTVYKEGAYQLRPGPDQGGAQALDLQPAQGGFVEFTFPDAGLYPIVTHKFANVGKGAMGLFEVGNVAMPAGGGSH